MSRKTVVLTSSTACRTRPRCCFLHTRACPHFPHALRSELLSDHLPDLRCCPLHTEIYPARIHRMCLSAPLAEPHSPTVHVGKGWCEKRCVTVNGQFSQAHRVLQTRWCCFTDTSSWRKVMAAHWTSWTKCGMHSRGQQPVVRVCFGTGRYDGTNLDSRIDQIQTCGRVD